MPLLDSDFDQKFVHVKQEDTVAQALGDLRDRGGEDDWHFVVERPGNEFGVLKVGQLKEYLAQLGPALFELTFAQLGSRVLHGRIAQQEQIGIGTAEKWALEDAQGVLVVMQGNKVAGRLYKAAARGADPFPASTMNQLYGDYIDTHLDARSRWRPAGVEPPTCPHCGHQGFYRIRPEDGVSYCDECGETVAKGA
jgi:hypothetical protein